MTQVIDRTPPSPAQPSAPAASGEEARIALEEAAVHGPVVHLNAFQLLMRRWTKLHAYNAGQVMEVSGKPDRDRWKRAAEAVIGELGLGKPRFINGDLAVQFLPGGDVQVETAASGHGSLEEYFNEELNRPFAAGDVPIRFCILPANRGAAESHYLAAVYDHWIADSRAMRELLHRIFERYRAEHGQPATDLAPLTLEAPPFKQLFRKHVGRLARLVAMRESLKNIWQHRHGYRLNLRDPIDMSCGFVFRELPEGLIERLHAFAKARGASVNDVFIAVIGQATGAYTAPDRTTRSRKPLHFARRKIGIGTIVDIREAANMPLDRVFNLYLSSYSVLMENPESRTADDLVKSVAGVTTRMKKTQAPVRGYFALAMARFWYDVYDSPRFRASLLHKTVPMVAGISNVNMTGSWADPGGPKAASTEPRVLDYLRISPAGPLIPLVFTLTTVRGRLTLCVTYRKTSFQAAKLQGIVDDFVKRLEAVSG